MNNWVTIQKQPLLKIIYTLCSVLYPLEDEASFVDCQRDAIREALSGNF